MTARDAYDPFGKRRFANGNYDAAGALVIDWSPAVNSGTDRGFTGHEQLDDIGLTHMNGRIYDAALGRFLSGDKEVTDPLDLQDFNRFSYVNNDPLAHTDPSGWSPLTQTLEPVIVTGRQWCGDACINAFRASLLASADRARRAAKHWRVVVPVVRSVVRFGGGMAGGIAGGAIATGCATVSGGLCSPLAPGIVLGSRWAGQEGAVLAFDAVLNATVGAEQPAEGLSTDADKPVRDVVVPADKYPETADHIKDAQENGQPEVPTIDRKGARDRRADAMNGESTTPGKDRDEYPPAMFEEGGKGSSVRPVSPSDNRGAGACIGAQCRSLPDGVVSRLLFDEEWLK